MEDGKKCPYCGKPVISGHHIVADIDCVKYIFCPEERIEKKAHIDESCARHLVKYSFLRYVE